MARAAGLSVGSYVSIDDTREEVIRRPELQRWAAMLQGGLGNVNPSHDLWDLYIARYAYCGLKVELLRDNPRNARGFEALPGFDRGWRCACSTRLCSSKARQSAKTAPSR